MLNIESIRIQFPILQRTVNNQPLIYLDNAASSQKPQRVLDAIMHYYTYLNANVHRGIHTLSQEATIAMENSRKKVQHFINAKYAHEVLFTSGTTDAINTIAYALQNEIKSGDEIIITQLEHHSNIVPWQMLCQKTGAKLKYIPIDKTGALQIDVLDKLLTDKTRLVAVNHISNAIGVINPIEMIIQKAHAKGAWVLIDGAQAIPHTKVDVQSLNADFYCFSAHKMYGSTGIGILYGKEEMLNRLEPFKGGGEMIETVTMEKTTYAKLPFKYEAGTPNICGNIVLGEAIDFMEEIGIENIQQHENDLLNYTTEQLSQIPQVEIYGLPNPRAGAISFNLKMDGVHSSDVGMILDKKGIAVRTGHHCAQPIMDFFQIPGTVRASFSIFNTKKEVDKLVEGVELAANMLG